VLLDALLRDGLVELEHVADVLGVRGVGAGGEADEVDEEDRDDLPLLPRRPVGRERAAALRAEARVARDRCAARGTGGHASILAARPADDKAPGVAEAGA